MPVDLAVGDFRAEPATPSVIPAPTSAVTLDRRPLVRLVIKGALSAAFTVVLARIVLTLARTPPGQLR